MAGNMFQVTVETPELDLVMAESWDQGPSIDPRKVKAKIREILEKRFWNESRKFYVTIQARQYFHETQVRLENGLLVEKNW